MENAPKHFGNGKQDEINSPGNQTWQSKIPHFETKIPAINFVWFGDVWWHRRFEYTMSPLCPHYILIKSVTLHWTCMKRHEIPMNLHETHIKLDEIPTSINSQWNSTNQDQHFSTRLNVMPWRPASARPRLLDHGFGAVQAARFDGPEQGREGLGAHLASPSVGRHENIGEK